MTELVRYQAPPNVATVGTGTGDGSSITDENTEMGGKVRSSGQLFGVKFKDAFMACYTNATQRPVLLSLYMIVITVSIAEVLQINNGPMEQWLQYLETNKSNWTLGNWISTLLTWVFKISIANKLFIIGLLNFLFPYFFKPSNKNFKMSVFLGILSVFFMTSTPLEIVIFGHAWFLFTQLRDPEYKLVVVIVICTVFLIPYTGLLEHMAGSAPATPKPSASMVGDIAKTSTSFHTLDNLNRESEFMENYTPPSQTNFYTANIETVSDNPKAEFESIPERIAKMTAEAKERIDQQQFQERRKKKARKFLSEKVDSELTTPPPIK